MGGRERGVWAHESQSQVLGQYDERHRSKKQPESKPQLNQSLGRSQIMEKFVGFTKEFRFILQLFTEPVKFQEGN